MRASRLFYALVISTSIVLNAQISKTGLKSQELAEKYLSLKNEVYFSFKAKDQAELRSLSEFLSFSHKSIDKNLLFVEAYANKNTFNQFLEFNLPYQIKQSDNELHFNPHLSGQSERFKNDRSGTVAGWDTSWDAYPTYSEYTTKMQYYAETYPDLCSLQSIGKTKNGRDLWVLKISDNVSKKEAEPEFLYTSSMHGDELAGFPLMIRLIDHLLTNYNTDSEITQLINTTEIYVNPLANPDGTYGATGNNIITAPTRSNSSGQDLNRNYPDNINNNRLHYSSINGNYENETLAFMNFESRMHFVLSANFHGGTELVNYPNDNTTIQHSDHDYYEYISNEYAVECQNQSDLLGDTTYMTIDEDASIYPSPGVTNGAAWYLVYGGRQDYMNYFRHAKEVTVELSDVKYLEASQLPNHWTYNKQALLNYVKQANYGFQGKVSDESGNPISAKIKIPNHDQNNSWITSSKELGDYYRLIKSGNYTVTFEAPGYESQTTNISVVDNRKTVKNIVMQSLTREPNTSDVNICEGSSAELTATGTGIIKWYDNINDTNAIHTGTNFVTPTISTGTSYYVENVVENPNVGAREFNTNGGFLGGERYLVFDSRALVILNEVSINANQPGEIEIQLQDSTGKMIDSRILLISSSGYQNITLDFIIPIASNLRLVAKELSNGLRLYRNNSNTSYPYTNGNISIKSSSANDGTNFYYFFYDWKISNFKSQRKEVKVTTENRSIANFEYTINTLNNGEVYFINTSNNANSYYWGFGDGIGNTTEADPTYTFTETGTYNVQLTSSNPTCGSANKSIPIYVTVGTLGTKSPILKKISIYPNPIEDKMVLKLPKAVKAINFQVFDMSGNLVLSAKNKTPKNQKLNIMLNSDLSSGTYFIRIEDIQTQNTVIKKLTRN